MPDILMCESALCPARKSCHRFTAMPDPLQCYFRDIPEPNRFGSCNWFIANTGRVPKKETFLAVDIAVKDDPIDAMVYGHLQRRVEEMPGEFTWVFPYKRMSWGVKIVLACAVGLFALAMYLLVSTVF